MLCKLTLERICTMTESPLFDRKSARIDAKTLAIHLIAFANADGGVIAVGVEDDGTITGIDGYQEHINELLRVPFDYCKPSVQIETELLACTNRDGEPDYILLIEVLQSNELHANQADDVFFRVGDKSKKLNFDERLQLMYAKGTRYFEDTPVPDAAMEDIDLDFVREYTQKLGYRKSPEEYLRENKEFNLHQRWQGRSQHCRHAAVRQESETLFSPRTHPLCPVRGYGSQGRCGDERHQGRGV